MLNVNTEIKDKELIIKIDISKDFGISKSGKSVTVASSQGFVKLGDISLNLNVIKARPL